MMNDIDEIEELSTWGKKKEIYNAKRNSILLFVPHLHVCCPIIRYSFKNICISFFEKRYNVRGSIWRILESTGKSVFGVKEF